MHVLMLGWEFPPYITGGLGTACFGLTKAMNRRGFKVTFLLPKAVGSEQAQHVDVLGPDTANIPPEVRAAMLDPTGAKGLPDAKGLLDRTTFINVEAGFTSPYQTEPGPEAVGQWIDQRKRAGADPVLSEKEAEELREKAGLPPTPPQIAGGAGHADYGEDLVAQVERYAYFCLAATRGLDFDVIHAHDWMTYPAGMMIAGLTGRPLVVHVHSTEFDRSGIHVNQRVYDIERRGMHAARRVIAVSQLTRNIIASRYGLPDRFVEVIYNGVDFEPTQQDRTTGIGSKDKIVLYFGRITMQKGPEYFIAAAKRVLEVMDNVKFVVAGSGDMARQMIEMAANLGIGHKVLFTGFLRGNDIKRVFSLADLYVMPSVSEPFGIAPLEAMSHDVPVLISKSSGVSEVLTHALKVDFWDIDAMANKIIAVLRHPPLSQTLREHGAFEVRGATWDGAAERCGQVYHAVISEMSAPPCPCP